MEAFQAIVAGGGAAGCTAAALLAAAGVRVALVTGAAAAPDPRTVALMLPALKLLERLDLWPGGLKDATCPLRKLRLVDDTGWAAVPASLTFSAEELGEEAFGWNIPLGLLLPALAARAAALGVILVADDVSGLDGQTLKLAGGGTLSAPVFVAADGKESVLRAAAGIRTLEWSYDQCAIAASFSHSRPHHDTSTEFHTASGPFTTVPMPGGRSSLVWMERPQRAAELMALGDKDFAAEIQLRCHGGLGAISAVGRRKLFPMRGLTAQSFAERRVLLAGEAAHLLPPIGAQGLNMSLRDAAEAAQRIAGAIDEGHDPGGPEVMAAYGAARRADVAPRQAAVDLMNRSLLTEFIPVHAARAAALKLIGGIAPLRKAVMEHGLRPNRLPVMMRG